MLSNQINRIEKQYREKSLTEVRAGNLFDDCVLGSNILTDPTSSSNERLLSLQVVMCSILQVLEPVVTHEVVLCGGRA